MDIQFHHQLYDEGVHATLQSKFKVQHFRITRREVLMVEDYGCKRVGSGGDGRGTMQQKLGHKFLGLKCMEKYSGPDNKYTDREMFFWLDIPCDVLYRSPLMDNDEESHELE